MTFVPTDLRTLEEAIRDGIISITPSLESGLEWNHNPRPEPSPKSRALRQFFLQWEDADVVIGGATGRLDYEVEATLIVITHYWSVNPDLLGELLVQDHMDVNRHFSDRLETIVGLLNWSPLSFVAIDEESRTYAHSYLVSYLRR